MLAAARFVSRPYGYISPTMEGTSGTYAHIDLKDPAKPQRLSAGDAGQWRGRRTPTWKAMRQCQIPALWLSSLYHYGRRLFNSTSKTESLRSWYLA